ncbi:NAD(P)(+)--arginine ADP-ribosyltransferase 2-like [Danio aesculapii]|uniref:NAD(P)(+)--arginine ADP-ribosyltransferase 2-like n=1 Tax=Danio aesculapii TaxID=1142201 RepID=UPI0024BF8B83|nr:NAD(P)(+)--arginine ADP-ribosyltransferase 2-like [Danio aesculapii]
MEMLRITEALLLMLAALLQDHTAAAAEAQGFPLDMALSSVDDQFSICRAKMSRLVEKTYLKEERSNSNIFNELWRVGEQKAVRVRNFLRRFKKKHSIAIYVYTSASKDVNKVVYPQFNNDTRNGKQNYTLNRYRWYSLYFLLTDAVQILRKEQKNKCYDTYRATKSTFNLHKSKEIRFGSFTSTSLDFNQAKRFGKVSCFKIHTCEGADVTKYSSVQFEQEVLIPPYEKFRVTAVLTKTDGCETVYKLESSGKRSDLDCALFRKNTLFPQTLDPADRGSQNIL